jgi:polysaccharide biosynthesis protein PslG
MIAAVSTQAADAFPGRFWGVVPQSLASQEQLNRLKRGGVDSIRISIPWGLLQPEPGGTPDWSGTDPVVAGAVRAGMEVLPYIYGAPTWAVPQGAVPGSHGMSAAPRHLPVSGVARAGWMALLRLAVGRYGPRGSFWLENPGLPKRPVRTWQIWNEPNFKYFVVRPNPAEYGKLVKISYAAIRGADPGARLVLGGLFARPKEARYKRRPRQAYFATDFLNQMYRRTPGIRSRFHGIALHPYTRAFKFLKPEIEEVRHVMAANRDARKGLWITELGWSSQPPTHTNLFAKGVRGQVVQLKGAFSVLRNSQRKWKIKRVYWFSVDDQPGACNFCDGTGLFGEGFTPKPAWFAYVRFAGGRAR